MPDRDLGRLSQGRCNCNPRAPECHETQRGWMLAELGPPLSQALERKVGLDLSEMIGVGREVGSILASLASAGVVLPDANPGRFARESGGSLMLIDLAGVSMQTGHDPTASHLSLARGFCLDLLKGARRFLPPEPCPTKLPEQRLWPNCCSCSHATRTRLDPAVSSSAVVSFLLALSMTIE